MLAGTRTVVTVKANLLVSERLQVACHPGGAEQRAVVWWWCGVV